MAAPKTTTPVTFAELHALREQLSDLTERAREHHQDFRFELDPAFDALGRGLRDLAYVEAHVRLRADRGG